MAVDKLFAYLLTLIFFINVGFRSKFKKITGTITSGEGIIQL